MKQERSVALLPLADDDHAVHLERLEHEAHRRHGGGIGGVAGAEVDVPRRHDRRGFGGADELQGQVALRSFSHALPPQGTTSSPPSLPTGVGAYLIPLRLLL